VIQSAEWTSSTPARFAVTRRPHELSDVRLDQVKSDISAKLLPSRIQYEARASFNSHFIGVLVVRRQKRERRSIMHPVRYIGYVDAEAACDFALDIPPCDVAAISEKRTAQPSKNSIEDARMRASGWSMKIVLPLLDGFHEKMCARRCRRAGLQPNVWMKFDMRKSFGHIAQVQVEPLI
jgi:hypothetical protein